MNLKSGFVNSILGKVRVNWCSQCGNEIDERNIVVRIFIDLIRDLETIDHHRLIKLCEEYEVRVQF